MTTTVDPISFEVIRNALVAATDEMVLALKRSAYSTNIKTRSDFACTTRDFVSRSACLLRRSRSMPMVVSTTFLDMSFNECWRSPTVS